MSEPTVTVAIATYNRAALLGRAIRSVLRQTVQDFEILVIDDGSSDDTEATVAAFGDARIKYVRHERNKGLPAGRNTAIRAAAGRVVAFLDDDDEWLEQKIERQLRALNYCDAVLCAAYVNDRHTIKRFARTTVTPRHLRRGNPFDPSTLMVRTEVIRAVMFDETLRVGEDWDAFIRLSLNYRVGYLQDPLIIYSEHAQGRMTAEGASLSLADLEKRMSMLNKHRPFFGPFWFNYHVAAFLLSHFRQRTDKRRRVMYAIQRCGIAPVARLLFTKALHHRVYEREEPA